MTDDQNIGWYNEETGQWDKDEPDLPAFVKRAVCEERGSHSCSMWYGYCLDCGETIPWGLW